EGRSADTQGQPAVGREIRAPEADVVALACARADLLLEGEILVAAEQEERAHRRIRIGTVEDDAPGDAEAAAQRDRVGWAPAGGGERALDVCLAADERDVQRSPAARPGHG